MALAIRKTQGSHILASAEKGKGLTQDELISSVNQRRLVLFSNRLLDARFGAGEWEKEGIFSYPARSGTLAAHVPPGTSFRQANVKDDGAYVIYTDSDGIVHRFPVPKEHRNLRDAVLVAEHGFDDKGNPVFEIHADGNTRVVHVPDERRIEAVQGFPADFGWYATEDKFGIPVGGNLPNTDPRARLLLRAAEWIGLIVRGGSLFLSYRDISFQNNHSDLLGALALEKQKLITYEIVFKAETALRRLAKGQNPGLMEPIQAALNELKKDLQ